MQPEIHLFASPLKACRLEEYGILACKPHSMWVCSFSQHFVADDFIYQVFNILTQKHGLGNQSHDVTFGNLSTLTTPYAFYC